MSSVFVVGGTFDHTEGKPSKLAAVVAAQVRNRGHEVAFVNGGNVSELNDLYDEAGKREIVLWFPNVPNNYGKNITVFKVQHPKVFLVTSKRNDGSKYSFAELVNHALGLKANLTVEYTKFGNRFQGRVFDPLGCVWAHTEDFVELTNKLFERIEPLLELTRVRSHCLHKNTLMPKGPELKEFFQLVKDRATTFHDLVHPANGVERFLGNASFRCERGFPSIRQGNVIFVSRRNVDKRYIGPDAFVQVELVGDGVGYYGEHKPSVDTPIQLRLYKYFKKVTRMLHSHVYAREAPFTEHAIPCGAIEEYYEIVAAQRRHQLPMCNFALNLVGHGSIVLADDLEYMRSVEYYARPIPEVLG